jgi:hypothetical protein
LVELSAYRNARAKAGKNEKKRNFPKLQNFAEKKVGFHTMKKFRRSLLNATLAPRTAKTEPQQSLLPRFPARFLFFQKL